MTSDDFIKAHAATIAWREAGDDAANSVLGILFVLRNRVDAGWGNWIEVLENAESHDPGSPSHNYLPDPREHQFAQVMEIVDSIYDGTRRDNLTGGALYWGRLGKPTRIPAVVRSNPEGHPRTGQVGVTTFFK